MAVPKAPMGEDDGAMLCEDKIGRSGQPFHIETIAEAARVKAVPDKALKLRATPANGFHVPLALIRCQYVHRGLPRFMDRRLCQPHLR